MGRVRVQPVGELLLFVRSDVIGLKAKKPSVRLGEKLILPIRILTINHASVPRRWTPQDTAALYFRTNVGPNTLGLL